MIKSYRATFTKIIDELRFYSLSYYKERLICLVVFGSVAKDLFSPTSDIDLLFILKDKSSSYQNYSEYFDNIEERLHLKSVEINPIFKTASELGLWLPYMWSTDFLILFDREDFFKTFLVKLDKLKSNNLIFKDNYIELLE